VCRNVSTSRAIDDICTQNFIESEPRLI
jgi:hypothetical protein